MIKKFYLPTEAEQTIKNAMNNRKQSDVIRKMYMNNIQMKHMKVKTIQNEEVYFIEVHFPKIGIFYVLEETHLFHQLKFVISEKSEKDMAIVLDQLLEKTKEQINIYEFYTGMLEYAKMLSERESLTVKWEIQRQFRELIGIEEK